MTYKIKFYPQVKSDKQNVDSEIWDRILRASQSKLKKKPAYFGKPLRGTLKPFWSMRVGDYRVGYLIQKNQNEVHVVAVGHRKDIYDRLARGN